MRSSLVKAWDELRSNYWFIPSLMALGAIALALGLTQVDELLGPTWIERIPWLHTNQPEGARTLLSTIAGSMVTVAGVTFSITIAAVAYASSQFGPRLLTNFMKDRGNQFTLGTFIATFLYCLLVLRTVRSVAEPGTGAPDPEAFVPHLSILVGVLFALASLGVLIFFIHHVPASVHVAHVVARIGHELHEKLDSLFPKMIGEADGQRSDDHEELPPHFVREAAVIRSHHDGYVHNIDAEGLLHLAHKHDLIVQVDSRPGAFVIRGQALLQVWPPDRVHPALEEDLRDTFAWGVQRTSVQDVLFLVDELVEIAARALSPGVNDPFTAMNCVDWLASGLSRFAQHQPPAPFRKDKEDTLRIVAPTITFEGIASAVFDQLRPYVSADRNAALHMMTMLDTLVRIIEHPPYRDVLLQKATVLLRACQQNLTMEEDLHAIEAPYESLVRLVRPAGRHAVT